LPEKIGNVAEMGINRNSQRLKEARWASAFAKACDDGSVIVPGHEGRQYRVRKTNPLGFTCHEGRRPCWGNSSGVCYHVLAAAIYIAREKYKAELALCGSKRKARLLARLGGQAKRIRSAQSGRDFWVVWRNRNDLPKPATQRKEKIGRKRRGCRR